MKNEIDSYLKTRAKNTERRFRYVLKVYLNFLAKKFGRMSYDNLKKADTIDVLHFYDFLKSRKGTPARDNPTFYRFIHRMKRGGGIGGLHVENIRQFARHDSILTTQGYFAKFSPKDSAANKFDWM